MRPGNKFWTSFEERDEAEKSYEEDVKRAEKVLRSAARNDMSMEVSSQVFAAGLFLLIDQLEQLRNR